MTFSPPALLITLAVQPLVHVDDLHQTISFYQALGATLRHINTDGDFAMITVGATQIGLLAQPANPNEDTGPIELTLVTDDLDQTARQVLDAGIELAAPITDTAFGRQLKLVTPDGHTLKINQFVPWNP